MAMSASFSLCIVFLPFLYIESIRRQQRQCEKQSEKYLTGDFSTENLKPYILDFGPIPAWSAAVPSAITEAEKSSYLRHNKPVKT